MARPIVLSNGTLHVGINLYGLVHDFYYPYVGHENHAAGQKMRHRIGVWVDGMFGWLDDGDWQFNMKYDPRALIGHFTAHCPRLQMTLEFTDCVDSETNVFLRSIQIINAANRPREIRLFLHQMLLISNSLNRDTAQYLPGESAILHYKGDRAFVAGGKDQNGKPFQQFSIGLFGIEGHEGVFRDAEDGVLSGNVVEFGKVDSVFAFHQHIEPFSSSRVDYWLTAAKSETAAIALHRYLQTANIHTLFERTVAWWQRWLRPAEKHIAQIPKELQAPFRRSLLILKSQIDRRGAVIASTDTAMLNYSRDSYAYCWPRDASYALWPLLRLGYKTELKNFFAFCRDALRPEGFLMHKYQANGAIGSSWHPYLVAGRVVPPIQEDETAIVIFLLGQFIERHKDKELLDESYDQLVVPAANYLASNIDEQTGLPHATYDLWEEKFLTHTYTVAVVYAALRAAGDMAAFYKRPDDEVHWHTAADQIRQASQKLLFNPEANYFYKGFINHGKDSGGLAYDTTVDVSSFYGAYMFGLFDADSPELTQAYTTLFNRLQIAEDGPTIAVRYEKDQYNSVDHAGLGNPWFVTSLWLAQYDVRSGKSKRARKTIDWTTNLMLPTGVLSEQINPFTQKFISVAPLTWSQAEYLNTIMDFAVETAIETKEAA